MPSSNHPALGGTLTEGAPDTTPSVRAYDGDSAARRQVVSTAIARRAASLLPDVHVLLLDATAMVAEALEADYCGLSSADADGKLAKREIMYASTDMGQQSHSEHPLESGETQSLSSYATSVGHPVVVPRLVEEIRFTDVSLRQLGIVSAVEFPVKQGNLSLASLGVYFTSERALSEEEMMFAESVAHLLTVAAVGERSRKAAVQMNGKHKAFTNVSENLDVLSLILTPENQIGEVNTVCQSVTGFRPSELEGRHLWGALLIPEEVPAVQEALQKARDGEPHVCFECYVLTKHGQRRRISWSFTNFDEEGLESGTLFGAGSDITDKCDALEKLQAVEAAHEKTKQTLTDLKRQIEEGEIGTHPVTTAPAAPTLKLQLPEDVPLNRRRQRRISYPFQQQIAPMAGGQLPEKTTFRDVICYDIAAGGFSYLAETPPNYEELVVALGSGGETIYLTAEIRNVRPHEFNDRPMHLVGCRYTGRAHY